MTDKFYACRINFFPEWEGNTAAKSLLLSKSLVCILQAFSQGAKDQGSVKQDNDRSIDIRKIYFLSCI
jgi:hypothetical protein